MIMSLQTLQYQSLYNRILPCLVLSQYKKLYSTVSDVIPVYPTVDLLSRGLQFYLLALGVILISSIVSYSLWCYPSVYKCSLQ